MPKGTDFKSAVYTSSTTRPVKPRLWFYVAANEVSSEINGNNLHAPATFLEARTGVAPVYRVLQTLA